MDTLMTQPWYTIREMYARSVSGWPPLGAMLALIERIEQSQLNALFGWKSMHDLYIVQTPVTYPYNGPCLRISPQSDGTIEFRYIDTSIADKQWSRVVPGPAAFDRLVGFTTQLHWFTVPDAAPAS